MISCRHPAPLEDYPRTFLLSRLIVRPPAGPVCHDVGRRFRLREAERPLLLARIVELAEEDPALAVEPGELLLLDRVVISQARVDLDARQQ